MGYPRVSFGEFLRPNRRPYTLAADEDANLVGMRLYGLGPFHRELKPALKIAKKSHFIIKAGDIIYNKLFAWKGTFGIVPIELDGMFVSDKFPTYEVDESKAVRDYLRWYFRCPDLWEQAGSMSTGSAALSKLTLNPPDFLKLTIPLPPLSEQRRIVARIEQLAARINEARELRRLSTDRLSAVITSEEMRIWPDVALADAPSLEDVTTYLARGRQSKQGPSDHYLIKTQHVQMGRVLQSNMTLAPHVAAKVPNEALVQPGDVLVACSAAGCLGRVAFNSDANHVASTDTHVAIARADRNKLSPEYLYAYLRGAQGQHQLRSREKGDWQREKIGFRLTELNVADMRKVPVPVPSFAEQKRILAHLGRFYKNAGTLSRLAAETAAELDALIPSILDKAFKGEL